MFSIKKLILDLGSANYVTGKNSVVTSTNWVTGYSFQLDRNFLISKEIYLVNLLDHWMPYENESLRYPTQASSQDARISDFVKW